MRMIIMIAMTIPMERGSAPTKIEPFAGLISLLVVKLAFLSFVGMFSRKSQEPPHQLLVVIMR